MLRSMPTLKGKLLGSTRLLPPHAPTLTLSIGGMLGVGGTGTSGIGGPLESNL